MENLPDSLFTDPRDYASTSNSLPQNTTGAAGAGRSFSAIERVHIHQLIRLIHDNSRRAEAVSRLNNGYKLQKEWGNSELGFILWNSKGTPFALLEEVKFLFPLSSGLRMEESTRACNALGLLQCIATHPEAKMELIKAQIPVYVCPLLNSTEKLLQFEYLRLHGLGLIGALVKDGSNATAIVHFLLEIEMVPLCLKSMDVGGVLTKMVATLILTKILEEEEGKTYIGAFIERFFTMSKCLSKVVDEFSGIPPNALLRNVLNCYLRLSKMSRCHEALTRVYPMRLKNPVYLNNVCDESTRSLADQVLRNIVVEPQAESVALRNRFSSMRV